jgi:hypothetical protein
MRAWKGSGRISTKARAGTERPVTDTGGLVLDPARGMRAARIAVGPINHAAALVPLILAVNADAISGVQSSDALG